MLYLFLLPIFFTILIISGLRYGKQTKIKSLSRVIILVINDSMICLTTLVGISFFFWLKKDPIEMPLSVPLSMFIGYVICVLAGRYAL